MTDEEVAALRWEHSKLLAEVEKLRRIAERVAGALCEHTSSEGRRCSQWLINGEILWCWPCQVRAVLEGSWDGR